MLVVHAEMTILLQSQYFHYKTLKIQEKFLISPVSVPFPHHSYLYDVLQLTEFAYCGVGYK